MRNYVCNIRKTQLADFLLEQLYKTGTGPTQPEYNSPFSTTLTDAINFTIKK